MWRDPLRPLVLAGCLLGARGQAAPRLLQLDGACAFENFLNGLLFELQGTTRNEAPWYKAKSYEYYIYYDHACGGSHDGSPRWIIDDSRPSTTRYEDLDSDGDCSYHAAVSSLLKSEPPLSTAWKMFCGNGWVDQVLYLREVQPGHAGSTTTVTTTTGYPVPEKLVVNGACQFKNWMNGLVFVRHGSTASGAPFYQSATSEYYLYYDPDCSGVTQGFSRWIIDSDKPDLTKTEDLDGDGECIYQARAEVTPSQSHSPPRDVVWKMDCGRGAMESYHLTLMEITTTSTKTSTTATTRTTTRTTATATTTLTKTKTTSTQTKTTTSPPPTTAPKKTTSGAIKPTSKPPSTTPATRDVANSTTAAASTCKGFACPEGMRRRDGDAKSTSCSGQGQALLQCQCCMSDAKAPTGDANVSAAPVGTTKPAASTTGPVTSKAPTVAVPSLLKMAGACEEMSSMNGRIFELHGRTKRGSPFYKAQGGNVHLYYDESCAGKGKAARWILDEGAPKLDATADLDGDGSCNYYARLITDAGDRPPKSGNWKMMCGGKFLEVNLQLEDVSSGNAAPTTSAAHDGQGQPVSPTTSAAHVGHQNPPPSPMKSFVLSGLCDSISDANGAIFQQQGSTKSGAPWYAATHKNEKYYIYYDPDCDGAGNASTARWILDDGPPSSTAMQDLDADGACNYEARVDSSQTVAPPTGEWSVYCGSHDGWKKLSVKLQPEFMEVTSGTCADQGRLPIMDLDACSRAAAALGYTSSMPVTISASGRPEGCAWDAANKELQMAPARSNRDNGASGNLHPLCTIVDGSRDNAVVSSAGGLQLPLAAGLLAALLFASC